MYIIEVSNGTATAEKRCRSKEKAIRIAACAANAGYICISNPELNKEQRRFEVKHVRVYPAQNPDIDIDF